MIYPVKLTCAAAAAWAGESLATETEPDSEDADIVTVSSYLPRLTWPACSTWRQGRRRAGSRRPQMSPPCSQSKRTKVQKFRWSLSKMIMRVSTGRLFWRKEKHPALSGTGLVFQHFHHSCQPGHFCNFKEDFCI